MFETYLLQIKDNIRYILQNSRNSIKFMIYSVNFNRCNSIPFK